MGQKGKKKSSGETNAQRVRRLQEEKRKNATSGLAGLMGGDPDFK